MGFVFPTDAVHHASTILRRRSRHPPPPEPPSTTRAPSVAAGAAILHRRSRRPPREHHPSPPEPPSSTAGAAIHLAGAIGSSILCRRSRHPPQPEPPSTWRAPSELPSLAAAAAVVEPLRVSVLLFSELEKHIEDMHVLITTPFHPAYVSAERIKKAKNLQLLLTAGIGSDHIDLKAAAAAGLTVAEVTGSNVVSVAEDELMRILILVRNFLPGYHQVVKGEWNVAGISYRAYDLEGKTVGTVGAGRIGKLLLQRLKPFNCNLLYHDRLKMEPELEAQTGAKFEADLDAMLPKCDIVVINMPLTEKTRGMFDKEKISKLKKGVLIVNNARGAIMDTQAVADACASGHVAGYSGDVWYPQPAPKDHPWRYMPNHAMTPHTSGTTIDAQLRYAAGVKEMLDCYFNGKDFLPQNYIVKEGQLAPQYL